MAIAPPCASRTHITGRRHGTRSGPAVATAICLGDRLAHPAARVHGRPRVLHRVARRHAISSPGARSISASRCSGSRSSRSRSAWAWSRAWSCRSSSAPIGAVSPMRPRTSVGPLFAYEGLMAFFLEAAFLGILLFGRKLVPRWAHFVAALMVALGTLFSSFWILAANSWMQTPAGYEMDRTAASFRASWIEIIFNPSFPYRLGAHRRRLLCDDRLRRARRRAPFCCAAALLSPKRSIMLSMTLWLLTRPGAAADPARRRARPQHARASAGEAGRDRGALGDGKQRAAHPVRVPDEEHREQPFRDRRAAISAASSSPMTLDGEVKGLKDFPRRTARRSRFRSSPSGSWSASAC